MGVDVKVPDLVWDLPWSVVDISADTPWRKTDCSLWQKVYIDNSVLVGKPVSTSPSQHWWDLVWFEPGLNILSRSSFPFSLFFPIPSSLWILVLPSPPSFGLSASLSCYSPLPSRLSLFKKERKKKEPKQPSSWAPYELLIPCSLRFNPPWALSHMMDNARC